MPSIKVEDLAYVRLRAPDLDVMEEFLTHFGLIRAARTPSALYMRGTDPAHHLHVTEKGEPGFLALAYVGLYGVADLVAALGREDQRPLLLSNRQWRSRSSSSNPS